MPDYDFSRLSHRSFEQLVQAIATKVLGPGIVVFGDGPDGGREATFEGRVPYPNSLTAWNGYGVVQAKYRQRAGNPQTDGNWAVTQLNNELLLYTDDDRNIRIPDYFIFATNVTLTPVASKGSKDRLIHILDEFKRNSPLIDYAIWDYDELRTFLDQYTDIRDSYSAFITPSDVLARIIASLGPDVEGTHVALIRYLEKELLSDEFVNLEQAGHSVDERIPLATVFVDLPISDDSDPSQQRVVEDFELDEPTMERDTPIGHGFIKRILTASSERLDPASLGASLLSDRLDSGVSRESRGRFVLIGGPGQGKTTLTQFVCQIFRAAIISDKPEHTLSAATRNALTTIRSHCETENITHKVVPRFPFKLILSDFAKKLSSSSRSDIMSVLSYLSVQISIRTNCEVPPATLLHFLSKHPSLIIFDGLDEVPASSNRDQVLEAIRDFWVDVGSVNADILSIATSRPQGYNKDFSPLHYQHLQLAELRQDIAWHFARRLAEVRYGVDEDRKQKVLGRLKRALSEASTSRLMRSPLQVTIMTALVDRIGQPPQALWELFDSYYNVIYHREVERDIPASTILRDYRPDIKAIHNQVGLVLQMDSERAGHTDAKLSYERFTSVVQARLRSEGHCGEELLKLTRQIVRAASQRLVFLVEVESDQVGFEIRSLQEFMAAESVMDGPDDTIRERLIEIASIPFWRNVFLFATGKCFAVRQELRDSVLAICAKLNESGEQQWTYAYLSGTDLAIALLEEGSSRRQPKYEAALARIGIRALDAAHVPTQLRLADVYEDRLKEMYRSELSNRLESNDRVRSLAAWNCLLHLVEKGVVWADRLATERWPSSWRKQVEILEAIAESTRNSWITARILRLIPEIPIDKTMSLLRSQSRAWLESQELEPTLAGALSLGLFGGHQMTAQVNVLNRGLLYGPIVRLSGGAGRSDYQRLEGVGGWHESWLAHKLGVGFMESPSKESLAASLRSLAVVSDVEKYLSGLFAWQYLPWPMQACVNSCSNRSELLDLADRVASGALGDSSDWLTAEKRWFTDGIGADDVLSMTSEDLPFGTEIGRVGFPVVLRTLMSMHHLQDHESILEESLTLFGQLSLDASRSFMATVINWVIVDSLFTAGVDDTFVLPEVDMSTLSAVYRVLPLEFPVPVHVVVDVINRNPTGATEFFTSIEDRVLWPHWYAPKLVRENLGGLVDALGGSAADSFILSILASLSEFGYLTGEDLSITHVGEYGPEERLSLLIIALSQEASLTGSIEELIDVARVAIDVNSDGFARIVRTLGNIRRTDEEVDRFVVALERMIPAGDYASHELYSNLLAELIGRRTSCLADRSARCRFGWPDGVVNLLRTDR